MVLSDCGWLRNPFAPPKKPWNGLIPCQDPFFHLVKTIFHFSPVGFKGNRFHYWKYLPTVDGCKIHFALPEKPWDGLILL